jgi:putative glutamine amidotransferase
VSARAARPVIGIPTQTLQSLGGVPAEIPPSWAMSQRYVLALTNAGAIPWLIPLVDEETLRGIYEKLEGIFLPGGADIDPSSYGETAHPLCDKTDRERDRVELALATWAIEDGKPVLGVCRGMQLINVAAGGSLFQDIADQKQDAIKHDYFAFGGQAFQRDFLAHDVDIASGTRLARVFGEGALRVNSMHHQAVRDIGRGLRSTAVAPDGLIEGLESDNGNYVVAVQWHPESLTGSQASARRVFEDFVEEAARRATAAR